MGVRGTANIRVTKRTGPASSPITSGKRNLTKVELFEKKLAKITPENISTYNRSSKFTTEQVKELLEKVDKSLGKHQQRSYSGNSGMRQYDGRYKVTFPGSDKYPVDFSISLSWWDETLELIHFNVKPHVAQPTPKTITLLRVGVQHEHAPSQWTTSIATWNSDGESLLSFDFAPKDSEPVAEGVLEGIKEFVRLAYTNPRSLELASSPFDY